MIEREFEEEKKINEIFLAIYICIYILYIEMCSPLFLDAFPSLCRSKVQFRFGVKSFSAQCACLYIYRDLIELFLSRYRFGVARLS